MFKVPAEAFKRMVAIAAKGASCNRILPVTSLLSINLTGGTLCLTTTDSENTVEMYRPNTEGKDMEAVVGVQLFSSLIAKQTCEAITIDLKKEYLEVKGNGVYKIPLIMDDEGMVKFAAPDFDLEGLEPEIVELSSIRQVLSVNKPSLCTSPDNPHLCTYLSLSGHPDMGNVVVTTNIDVICFNHFSLLGQNVAIQPAMMELIALNAEEKLKVYRRDNMLLFDGGDMLVYGPENDLIDQFPVDNISAYDSMEFPAKCEVSRIQLQSVLDRLSLFIEAFDKNGAYFEFTKGGLQIRSKQESSDEVLKYHKSTGFMPVTMLVDIPVMKAEIDSTPGDTVTLLYGVDNAIGIESGNIKKIVSLLIDDTAEAELDIPDSEPDNDEQVEVEDAVAEEGF